MVFGYVFYDGKSKTEMDHTEEHLSNGLDRVLPSGLEHKLCSPRKASGYRDSVLRSSSWVNCVLGGDLPTLRQVSGNDSFDTGANT